MSTIYRGNDAVGMLKGLTVEIPSFDTNLVPHPAPHPAHNRRPLPPKDKKGRGHVQGTQQMITDHFGV